MSYLIISIMLAFWFKYEFKRFPKKINLQTYYDFCSLYPLEISEDTFIRQSSIKSPQSYLYGLLFLLCIIASVLFIKQPYTLFVITLCLIYLSILDYSYYLTDIKYLGAILLLSFLHLSLYQVSFIQEGIISLLSMAIFFTLFHYSTIWIFKKEVFGLGDILLIISLSPLFSVNEIIRLLLTASLLGILFISIYYLKHRIKLEKLAFIPFISLAYMISIF